jgi:restriction system protein
MLLGESEGLPAQEAIRRVSGVCGIRQEEEGDYGPNARRFDKILRFATIAYVKAGWLAKADGRWFVTDEGKLALANYPQPERFHAEAVKLYNAWRKSRAPSIAETTEGDLDEEVSSDAVRSVSFEQAEDQAWQDIQHHLSSMDPYEFQRLVADLLAAMGYHVAWVAPPGKDGGVDVIAYTDPLGSQGPRIKVQVKRWTSARVDTDGLKSFLATINGADIGIFVTLAGFTRDAEAYARNQETRRITLIDDRRLVDLWVEHYRKLTDIARQRFPLTPIFFLTPTE